MASLKNRSKRLRYGLGRLCYGLMKPLVVVVPLGFWLGLVRAIGWVLGKLPLTLNPFERHIQAALGEDLPKEERHRLALQAAMNLLAVFFEVLHVYGGSSSKILKRITLVDQADLKSLAREKRGAILVSAHFGPFPLLQFALAKLGYPLRFLIQLPNNEWLGSVYKEFILKHHIEPIFIPRRLPPQQRQALTLDIVRRLKKGELVCLFVDEPEKQGGVPVRFFGRRVNLPAGPAVLHARLGFPIVPVYILREGRGYTIHIDRPLPIENNSKSVQDVTQAVTSRLEEIIKTYPQYWSWLSWPKSELENGERRSYT